MLRQGIAWSQPQKLGAGQEARRERREASVPPVDVCRMTNSPHRDLDSV